MFAGNGVPGDIKICTGDDHHPEDLMERVLAELDKIEQGKHDGCTVSEIAKHRDVHHLVGSDSPPQNDPHHDPMLYGHQPAVPKLAPAPAPAPVPAKGNSGLSSLGKYANSPSAAETERRRNLNNNRPESRLRSNKGYNGAGNDVKSKVQQG